MTGTGSAPHALRVGQGFDVHRFSGDPGRALVLGGVTIPGAAGLAGHSDADVVAHAVAEALLGAAGLGDLGRHFPASDPAWAGADSMALLDQVSSMVAAAAPGGSSTPTAPWCASGPGWPSTPMPWPDACTTCSGPR